MKLTGNCFNKLSVFYIKMFTKYSSHISTFNLTDSAKGCLLACNDKNLCLCLCIEDFTVTDLMNIFNKTGDG